MAQHTFWCRPCDVLFRRKSSMFSGYTATCPRPGCGRTAYRLDWEMRTAEKKIKKVPRSKYDSDD
jgi:hypothetical protein